jgi:hypothetical protein
VISRKTLFFDITKGKVNMNKRHFISIFITSLLPFFNCDYMVNGSGNVITVNLENVSFKNINISHGCEAEISRSDTPRVTVYIDDNIEPFLIKKIENGTLSIGLDSHHNYITTKFKAVISCPSVSDAEGSGGSDIKISGFNDTSDAQMSLSGGSRINGDWSCGNMSSNLSGGSAATLNGTGKKLSANLSGGSKLNFQQFTINSINANLSGGSIAHVKTAGTINANLSGGSRLYYSNGAIFGNIDLSGGSSTVVE